MWGGFYNTKIRHAFTLIRFFGAFYDSSRCQAGNKMCGSKDNCLSGNKELDTVITEIIVVILFRH